MIYFDRPGAIFLMLMLVGPILSALATVRALYGHEPRGWDAVYAWCAELGIIVGTLLIVSAFISRMYDEDKRVSGDGSQKASRPQDPRPIPNLNNTPLYEQATPLVKVDVMGIRIKRCCRTLINQRENGYPVDLREEVWKAQFGGRDNFVHFRDVIMRDAFAKKDVRKNSPFVVLDWRIVERGAEGKL